MHIKPLRNIYRRSVILKRFVPVRRPVKLRLKHFKMYVRLDDWSVGLRIAIKRNYEGHVTTLMRPLLQPGMVVVDVGASIGFYTLLAASHVGEDGRVLAFEPSFGSCELLRMSIAANGFGNVTVHRVAVADFDGVVGYATGGSNGVINRDDPGSFPLQVPAVKLDTFLQSEPRIDLIKMDIEGAEGLALAGMKQLLARDHPLVFTEFSPRALQARSGISPEAFLDSLRDIGYDLHVIRRTSGQNEAPQSNDEIMADYISYDSHHLDLVAHPNGRRPQS